MMKRPTLKLTIGRETLRVLSAMELAHIAGGDGPLFDTGSPEATCRRAAIPDPRVGPAALAPKP